MKLALFGSTGKMGKAVLAGALARGHEATILVRSEPAAGSGARVVVGDARDPKAIGDTIRGADAVIQCLGVGGMGDGKPNDLVPDATRLIVEDMRAQGMRRLVCASNVGVPGSGALFLRWVLAPLFARKLLPILEAKIKMEAILRASGLDWTAVRLAALTEKPARGKLKVSAEGRNTGFTITTADAAGFMLDIIEKKQFAAKAVAISN
ncbi:MAG: NAD(P)-dependent oxidoreductase [Hyphomonadaceae bacterium]